MSTPYTVIRLTDVKDSAQEFGVGEIAPGWWSD